MPTNDAVMLVDWLNLSIHLKDKRLVFGSDLVVELLKLARKECAENQDAKLVRAHFVAENFSPSVEAAIDNTLIAKLHKTRTAKEQADLVLAVLAMDHVHDANGCPRIFFLVTGDQDFVPLIERMIEAKAKVILIVASFERLSPEYRSIAAQQNVTLLAITDVVDIKQLSVEPPDASATPVLALYRLCASGSILGGRQDRNIELLRQWGLLLAGDHEVQITAWIKQFASVHTRKVAVPGRGATGNRSVVARRTGLNFSSEVVSDIILDADWILRRAGNALRPPTVGDLGAGRFASDDGRRLSSSLSGLKNVGWLIEHADGRFEARLKWAVDGLLEPLWRVVCDLNRMAYTAHSEGVTDEELFRALRSTPIAYDNDRRGGHEARDVIDLARRLGVIDTALREKDGFALVVVEGHPIAREASGFLRTLGGILRDEIGVVVAEHDVLARMRVHDETGGAHPIFGYDNRDRQRVLRTLRRSRLLERSASGQPTVRLLDSDWLRRLL